MKPLKPKNNFLLFLKQGFQFLFLGVKKFVGRIGKSVALMTLWEKRIAVLFALVFIVLGIIKLDQFYNSVTKLIPSDGGTYGEAVVGELRYLNPALAITDADNSTLQLMFSSLLRFDAKGNITPDLARSWTVSPDGLTYTFTLRDGVVFSDGVPLTADDVAYTIQTIQDPDFKSPLYESWKDVKVDSDGASTVTFTLAKAYGPFIYNCNFGVMPQHVNPDDFAKKIIGSGPYKLASSDKSDQTVSNLSLEANNLYYGGSPHIQKINLYYFPDASSAIQYVKDGKADAIAGVAFDQNGFSDFSFPTSKQLVLIANVKDSKLKDLAFRQQIFGTEKLSTATKISLLTSDTEPQKQKAEDLQKEFAARNINLSIKYDNATDMKNDLESRNFQLLLYGFDFGYDRDPYLFWHSSQVSVTNYSGYSDKNWDKLLEDARMTEDRVARNQKYDQFFTQLQSQALARYFDPIVFNFEISDKIKGVEKIAGNEAASRYYGVEKWFIETKRVRR